MKSQNSTEIHQKHLEDNEIVQHKDNNNMIFKHVI